MFETVSTIEGILWPGVPARDGAAVLSIVLQLEQSQWWSPDVIRQHQARQLACVINHARSHVPWYQQKLAGVDGVQLDTDEWLNLPVLSRKDVQFAGAQLQSTATVQGHGNVRQKVTSGSTGRPVTVVGTGTTELFWRALTLRDHFWHRRDMCETLAVIRPFAGGRGAPPDGSTSLNWGPATAGVVQTGPCHLLDVGASIEEQVAWLAKCNPGYLLTYPTVALALARWFSEHDSDLTNLLQVRTFGELLEPCVPEMCKEAWKVGVSDVYSSEEVGYIALQCPDTGNYHIQSESLFVEILDEAGRPCEAGETGRVVVTSLHNFAMPLIRYELGDYAEVGTQCSCGRGLPTLRRIVGRQRNMAILPDGRRVWPAIMLTDARAMAAMPPIEQFQLVQRSLREAELAIAAPRRFTEEEELLVRRWVDEAVGYSFALSIRYVDEIPRGPTGKYEDFRCEVESAD